MKTFTSTSKDDGKKEIISREEVAQRLRNTYKVNDVAEIMSLADLGTPIPTPFFVYKLKE